MELFPDFHLPHYTPFEWGAVIIVFGLVAWGFKVLLQPKVIHETQQQTIDVTAMVSQIVASVPSKVVDTLEGRLSAARGEIARLKERRTWILIGVQLHGYKAPTTDDPVYAPVLFNTITGKTKAPDEQDQRFMTKVPPGAEWWAQYCQGAFKAPVPRTELFAPRWHAIKDLGDRVMILGKLYIYK